MNPDICVMMPTYQQRKYLLPAIDSIRNQWPYTPRIQIFLSWVKSDMKNSLDVILDMDLHVHGYAGRLSDWESMNAAQKDRHVLSRIEWMHDYPVKKPGVWTQKQDALRQVRDHFLADANRLVCRFDSDDIMAKGWFEKALPIAQEILSRGKVPIIGPSYTITDEKLNPVQDVILPEFSMDKMLEGCIIPEYSIMPIGPLLDVGGFFDPAWEVPYRYNWYATMLRILKKYDCEVRLLPDIGFFYRQHRGQEHNRFTSRWKSKKNVQMLNLVAKHYYPTGV